MPSVRVKKSGHFTRLDQSTVTEPSRSLSRPNQPASRTSGPGTLPNRIRSTTLEVPQAEGTLGRVNAHIARNTWTAANSAGLRRRGLPWKEEATTNLDPETGIPPGSRTPNDASWDSESDDEDDIADHGADVVEHLDAIDPRISTVTNLTNAANSILIPPIISLKPSIIIPDPFSDEQAERESVHDDRLDQHVEDVLSKRQKLRRTLQGVGAFLKTPLGIVMAIYGFLVAFWGAGIVFFLGKIINLHNDQLQGYWVELCCQVETGLFTLTSVGLIPWRALDTWRIYRIWYYKRKTRRLRRKAGIPALVDEDDLPDPVCNPNYVHVLTDEEQDDLHYQQQQFMCSQTWYRPHGTETHRAFPINIALLICLLNDGNSIFQIGLCACMWGLNRFERPAATTATLLPAGFLCGIASAYFIWRGTQKTRRTQVVEEKLRAALAMPAEAADT